MTDDATRGGESPLSARESAITYELDEGEPPSEAVVRAVATLTDRTPLDLDPLYEVVDPDHLDELFRGDGRSAWIQDRSITFGFDGCRVTVTGEGVRVRERRDDAD